MFDLLSTIGIPANANLFKSYLLRDNKPLAVDFSRLLQKGDMSQNVVMKDKDKIYIAEINSAKMMVLGEVGKQTIVNLPNGSVSIKEALVQAGGLPYTADKAFIQVIRAGNIEPKIYLLKWDQLQNLPASSVLLIPGDIVYVAATPITDWNRFINQLLPSFAFFDTAFHGVKKLGTVIDGK